MNTEALRTVAATYGTPTYIFDVREVEARIRLLRSLLPEDTGLCFAVKANPFLIPYVADLVDRLEVCSPGEYEICIQEQIAPEKIVVSGVNKTYESMKRILSYSKGAGIYTIESEEPSFAPRGSGRTAFSISDAAFGTDPAFEWQSIRR